VFVEDLVWALSSQASEQEPSLVGEALGNSLNPTDESLIEGFDRSPGVGLNVQAGRYRILGYSGPEASPDQVMVEVALPMKYGDRESQLVAGGVVARDTSGYWVVQSMQPKDPFGQPLAKGATPPGLAWLSFAGS
jgi:hypothetical protein